MKEKVVNMMTSKEYIELEKRYKELYRKKLKLEKELEKVSSEYLLVMNRLNNEPIID